VVSKVKCGCRERPGVAKRGHSPGTRPLLEKIVQAGGIENPVGQVFELRLGGTHQALALFPFLEPVGDHLVRLLQVVHFGEGLAGETFRQPAAKPFCSWVPHRWVPFSLTGTRGIVS
jgi:hypothetical protein